MDVVKGAGQLVRLASGGPTMTVDTIRPDGIVETLWFDGATLLRDGFLPETLIPISEQWASGAAVRFSTTKGIEVLGEWKA